MAEDRTGPLTDEEAERGFRAWKELLDFGWRFCLEVYPQLYPDRDPLDVLRKVYRRKSEEHLRANERLAAVLGG